MCVRDISGECVAQKDITAWKVVMRGYLPSYLSQFTPSNRLPHGGTVLRYSIGKEVESPFSTTLGIFVYCNQISAIMDCICGSSEAILEVTIPKGTKFKTGVVARNFAQPWPWRMCIMAEKIKVEKDVTTSTKKKYNATP